MARTTSHQYLGNHQWKTVKKDNTTTTKKTTKSKNTSTKKSGSTKSSKSSTSNSSKNSAKGNTEKKTKTIEYNTLSGNLSLVPTNETIKLNVGDTIKIDNIGKYLSGKYYISEITRKISTSGYTLELQVYKPDFSDTMKISGSSSGKTRKVGSSNSHKTNRTHTVKRGETIYSISKKYYKNTTSYKNIKVKSTGKYLTSKSKLKIGQVLIIT